MRLGQYEWNPTEDLIAEGAFAEVFRARDLNSSGRWVALKIYKEALVNGTTGGSIHQKYSLEKEFQQLDGLSHTNILTYYGLDYIKHTDALGRSSSHPVLIMEYASEGTLLDFLKTRPDLPTLDALFRDIIQGVAYLHREGIIHRDLKPGNILICKNRRGTPLAKITDFGISKNMLTEESMEQSFTTGVGTPNYMAPEQFYKKKFGLNGEISERTDIWALGVIFYKVLTGKLPFGEGSKEYEYIRDAIIQEEPNLNNVPQNYAPLLRACLEKHAEKRPESSAELLALMKEGKESPTGASLGEKVKAPPQEPEKIFNNTEEDAPTRLSGEKEKVSQVEPIEMITLVNSPSVAEAQKETTATGQEKSTPSLLSIGLTTVACIGNIYGNYQLYDNEGNVLLIPSVIGCVITLYSAALFLYKKRGDNIWQMPLFGYVLFFYFPIVFADGWDYIFLFPVLILAPSWFILSSLRIKTRALLQKDSFKLLMVTLLTYYASYFLEAVQGDTGLSILSYILEVGLNLLSLFVILPNILFLTAVLIFLTNKNNKYLPQIWILFSITLIISSGYWVAYSIPGVYGSGSGFIQTLEIGYYLWYLSLILGFSIIIFDAMEKQKRKKFFYPIMGVLALLLISGFTINYRESQLVYDLKTSIEEVDEIKLYNTLKKGADPNWEKYALYNLISNYNSGNAVDIKNMMNYLDEYGWEDSGKIYQSSAEQAAMETGDVEVVKLLRKFYPTLSSEFSDYEDSYLAIAVGNNNLELTEYLLEIGQTSKPDEDLLGMSKNMDMYNLLYSNGFNTLALHFDFEEESEEFPEANYDNSSWTYNGGKYILQIKDENYSFWQTFNPDLDFDRKYTVEVTAHSEDSRNQYGIAFEGREDRSYFLTLVYQEGLLYLLQYKNRKWTELSRSKLQYKSSKTNVIKLEKEGYKVAGYIDGKKVLDTYAWSQGGKQIGLVLTSGNSYTEVSFDDFKVEGTKRKIITIVNINDTDTQ